MTENDTGTSGSERAKEIQVTREEDIVELRIDSREDLAMPFKPEHAMQLALQIQRAASDAKRYQQADTEQ